MEVESLYLMILRAKNWKGSLFDDCECLKIPQWLEWMESEGSIKN